MPQLPRDVGEVLTLPHERLEPESCATIVEHLSAHDPLPSHLVQKTVSMSDGIPLFVEELTKVVLESRGSVGPLELPLSLKELLAARLEHIGPLKVVAQLGACIGRSFSYDLLLMLANVDE